MQTIFPATYSTLCPSALARMIEEKYAFESAVCKLIVCGVHDTYLVIASSGKFVLRVYRAVPRSKIQIEEETSLLLLLKQNNIPVSYPLIDSSGGCIQFIQAAEGERHAVLFSYAPGTSNSKLDKQQLQILGQQMAKLHQVTAGKGANTSRWHFDFDSLFIQPLNAIEPNFTSIPDDLQWLRQTIEKAITRLTELGAVSFPAGYCHFDFLPKNFHFDGNDITFFDFDFMGYGALINDVMSFWQSLHLDVFAGRLTQDAATDTYNTFLDAYQAERPLNEAELQAIPYLSLGFWLFYMKFHTTHDQFLSFTRPPHLNIYIKVLRHLVEKNWTV